MKPNNAGYDANIQIGVKEKETQRTGKKEHF